MRFIVLTFLALILVGCATVDFQPYEGRNNLYEGEGGTKVAVDGIDFLGQWHTTSEILNHWHGSQ
jgi:hypothetical protein